MGDAGPWPALGRAAMALAVAAAATASAQSPVATPGPAARAGAAIDRAVADASHDVAEALVAARVRIALLEHLKGDAFAIHVELKGGGVVLTGTVSRRASRELATQVAASVEGVRSVSNRIELTVESQGNESSVSRALEQAQSAVDDALLAAHVKLRLIEELGRVAFDIEVEATDGVVSLSGTVPDAARRELASRVARATKGVGELHDLLRVE
jgi:hyperosmotically inducible periplasmic protein